MSSKRGSGRDRGGGKPGPGPGGYPSSPSTSAAEPTTLEELAAWLPGKLPSTALRVLCANDLLGVEAKARNLIQRDAWLLDVERLVTRGMAVIAYAAHRYNGFPDLDRWVNRELKRAIEALLEQDREFVIMGGELDLEDVPSYQFLAEALGMPLETAIRAAVVFNGLPADVRGSWYSMAIQKMSVADCVAAGLGTRAQIEARARRVVWAFSQLQDPGGGLP